ncbi:glycosyltransferase family 4 protein [Geomonas sp. Red32]|uniref:glycosyltransferase family 4 protein n=1 Tax=Geomonas sp. Red32 TaxID=2912856 RepID=UPI00202CD482|nr:glycosyltransferase family 4 protein [Geomonas sp. Red32]MCM0081373.1 glycosyltransferase family 4 protein [Geomonas sp. Red32]
MTNHGDTIRPPRVKLATSWVYPHVGGVSSHMSLLARQLGLADHEVISANHATAGKSAPLTRVRNGLRRLAAKSFNLETISLHARGLMPAFASLECDIVHCHDVMAAWAALKAREASGRSFKVIATLHGPISNVMVEEGHAPDSPDVCMVRRCELETWRRCDALIAVDTLQGEIAVEQGADPAQITTIPNAVDVEEVNRLATTLPLAKKEGECWILVPRRMAPKNGIEMAIRALPLMKKAPRLVIAGNGPERDNLEQLAHQLGVAAQVVFLGGLSHTVLMPLMGLCDMVTVPSIPIHGIEEATSISAIEGMALSRPVVATAIGGLRELILSEENGILVPPKDPGALAEAYDRVLADPELGRRLGAAAKQTVIERFSVDLWFGRHLTVYSNTVGR